MNVPAGILTISIVSGRVKFPACIETICLASGEAARTVAALTRAINAISMFVVSFMISPDSWHLYLYIHGFIRLR